MDAQFQQSLQNKMVFGKCILDPSFQTLSTPTKIIRLRGKLFSVLCCLAENNNQLVTREKLINDCWHGNIYTGQKAVTHTICHLRRLIKEQNINASITTLSKQGYVFRDHSARNSRTNQPQIERAQPARVCME
jgi:DNA-binding winged helix-turn-helix (wHTH) protein